MTSRLDRLFILLESGSAAVTRKAAAKQIGEVQKLHPHELHNLLSRLLTYLHSNSWDTRIAASQAVQAILENVPQWEPKPLPNLLKMETKEEAAAAAAAADDEEEDKSCDSSSSAHASGSRNGHQHHRLSFDSFDLNAVLFKGARLMGSEGSEFDPLDEGEVVDLREKLARQRALLNEKLGLSSGLNLEELVTLDDVRNNGGGGGGGSNRDHHQTGATGERLVPVQEILKLSRADSVEGLSCREKNRARRKARQQQQAFQNPIAAVIGAGGGGTTTVGGGTAAGNGSNGATAPGTATIGANEPLEPDRKRIKTEKGVEPGTPGGAANSVPAAGTWTGEAVPDLTGAWVDAVDWPLDSFCSKLFLDLFSPRWETRHGSATALRELLKSHADGGGKSVYMTRAEMERQHQLWLEDATLRLLCVLALDRFGDFVSDQVVAPVRETCAQVLGTVLRQLPLAKVHQTVAILLTFVKQKEWEVRHGGLLGIKYMLVVREDLIQTFLPVIINDVLTGLFDAVDDVGAVAASTLIPIATWLPKLLSRAQVSHIVKLLWDLLLDQDELASACNSFMGLLASILSLPSASSWIQMEPMSMLVPRLWPFLSHCSSSVRRSTLQTLKTLTTAICTEEQEEKQEEEGRGTNGGSPATPATPTPPSNGKSEPTDSGVAVLTVPDTEESRLGLNFGVKDWPPPLLQEALRHIFQRVLVEHVEDIQALAEDVWNNLVVNAELSALLHASCPYVSSWLCLAMQPVRLAFDPGSLIYAKPNQPGGGPNRERRPRQFDSFDTGGGTAACGAGHLSSSSGALHQKLFLGGAETVPLDVREKNVVRARCKAARMIGLLSRYLVLPAPGVTYTPETESPIDCYTKVLVGYLQSRSALQRLISSLVIAYWCSFDGTIQPGPSVLQERLRACLTEYVYYDEVGILFTRLLQECRDYLATLKQHRVQLAEYEQLKVLTLDQIYQIATAVGGWSADEMRTRYNLKAKVAELLEERRRSLLGSHSATALEQTTLHVSTQSSVSGAVVSLRCLPDRLNPVVKPLMESIKREECELLQRLSAKYLSDLLDQVTVRTPCPNSKIVTNLCTLLKSDAEFTPRVLCPDQELQHFDPANTDDSNPYHGILTLAKQHQRCKESGGGGGGGTSSNSGTSGGGSSSRGPGRPAASSTVAAALDLSASSSSSAAAASSSSAATATTNAALDELLGGPSESEEMQRKHARTQRLGATAAITTICAQFGAQLPAKLPILWQLLLDKLQSRVDEPYVERLAQDVIAQDETNDFMTALQLLEVAAPYLHAALHRELFELLPKLCLLLRHPLKGVRHMVGRCLATLAAVDAASVMTMVINEVVPLLSCIESVIKRQGAAEAITCIVNRLQFEIVPYVVLLVVPLLGRMSDPDQSVRLVSTHCFATLIQLMPLDGLGTSGDGGASGRHLSDDLRQRKMKDRRFLEYLFSPKTIPDVELPVKINAELRSYQQSGVNWLWFLNRYKLHGILCDDMGLGKTLQAICILAADHHQRSLDRGCAQLPSIVICPPTLTGHWVYEVEKFLPSRFLRPLHYVGLPGNREQLRQKLGTYNLIVASYDIVRKDIEFFSSVNWNYCILDEGHIIKNGRTKSSKAIKQLVANHRLILSGTPIQNNVLELWSLFDFLMPGFLGTEKQFSTRFSRPILASRDPKSSPKEQEAGALAMEALHRQVLPFLLRRVKEDVLTDLPPKITQDLLCELSPLQERLYEDFSRMHLHSSDIRECLENIDGQMAGPANKKTHVFQALRYLQNVCNHPKLVLSPSHPEYQMIVGEFTRNGSSMDDIEHSAKLPVLKQLLLDCGIGTNEDVSVNQHRALIFCQLKAMLDIVENDLLKKHLPAVSYLRLDGSVPPSTRHHIVTKFNGDPSIDVLLLTTQVGGLGLNLTGADTVIFVEHDWNPMKDLQAMDRAHRIGQKKVVNVYRLITRKSLEEKIMGLQKFKLLTANTVVSDENASMDTMGTDQLLDLFTLADDSGKQQRAGGGGATTAVSDRRGSLRSAAAASNAAAQLEANGSNGGAAIKTVLENLPELWDDSQYHEEYDLSQFLEGLKKNRQP
ncbi:TATA-binding protein-associated factor 172 [Anopheles arabiensis]|uniref:AGAP001820-PA n=2 Tax=gambiae species complex TaxID=44542 RepID=Q7PUQ9_ANOGA|nr:TATA-binding protein-associated factor 172 [Anopheles arabiensis]XP_040154338.1 TATA-binding protein-associated factor 172 [Anopheles arabiensis]XP_040154340.1 TATA-binding protein-associated factor 172 [Anopheles arabiensis]XP_040154341.1 TATA-binding protein-associated factor 172 [Anopheles arabiensis]XP_061501265.1 TATA-binding protein-associated factor 172 [Anopheles gambiae]XP_321235.5 TATA-binding protein-associated factor 172 [Anopheles gambiae]EAA01172.6 AGAP001820-PA [Anopheles ga